MHIPTFDTVNVGDVIPSLALPPVDRQLLALFAGASGDHNPVHIDLDFARKAGAVDVFAQGMLGMAWIARLITDWISQSALRRFDVRFQGIIHLGNAITCTGEIVEKLERDGERLVRIALRAANQYDETKIVGEALIALA
jgi:acyl dehydratase